MALVAALGFCLAAVAVSRGAGSAWSATGSLAVTRSSHTSFLLPNGKVLVVGGPGAGGPADSTAEVYDPVTGAWSAAPSPASPHPVPSGVRLSDGRILVTGGRYGGDSIEAADIYNPATHTWSATGQMKRGRIGHTMTLLPDGRVLAAGGWTTELGFDNTSELYNPATGTWTFTASMTNARWFHQASLMADGRVLITGGENYSDGAGPHFRVTEYFNPATGTWTAGAMMNTGRAEHRAAFLPDGRLIVVGGINGFSSTPALASTEILALDGSAWSFGPSMAQPRFHFPMAVLHDGSLLVPGGTIDNNSPQTGTANTERFDPVANVWSSYGTLNIARSGHTVTVLANGRALAAGGSTTGGTLLASAELSPVTDSVAPNTTATPSISPNGNGWTNSNVAFTLAAADTDGSGVQSITYTLSGAQTGGATVNGDTASFTVSIEGTTTLTYHAVDAAGNVEGDHTLVVKIDKTPPALAGMPNLTVDPTSASGAAVTFSPAAADSLSGLVATTTSPLSSGMVFPIGTTQVSVTATDAAGNTALTGFFVTVNSPVWTVRGSMPAPRLNHGAYQLADGRVFVAADADPGSGAANLTTAFFNPATNAWTAGPNTAQDHSNAQTVRLADGRILVAGGRHNGVPLNTSEVFDPATNTWSPTGALLTPRVEHTLTLLANGRVLAAGGYNSWYDSSAELFDPNAIDPSTGRQGRWTATGSMSIGKWLHSATLLDDGRVLVAGGENDSYPGYHMPVAEIYNPATGSWSTTAPLPSGRAAHRAAKLFDGRVIVVGGIFNFQNIATTAIFNPLNGSWAPGAPMIQPRDSFRLVLLGDGALLAVGGRVQTSPAVYTANTERYHPNTNTWTADAVLNVPRGFASATLLADGRVLAAGGWNGSAVVASSETLGAPVAQPVAPTASFTASPNPAACHQPVSFNASASQGGSGQIVNYVWEFGDGSTSSGLATSLNHQYSLYGSYTATLTVIDNTTPTPLTDTKSIVIAVNQGNQAPFANAGGPYTVNQGSPVQLNGGSSSDSNAGCGDAIVSYAWTIDGSIHLSGVNATLDTAAANLSAGNHSVSLQVTDSFGASSTASTTLTVRPVLVSVSVSPTTATLSPGQNRTFQAMGHFSDGSTQTLMSGNGGGGSNGAGAPLWSVRFVSPINVSACATAQYPAPISFSSQAVINHAGAIHETWSPGTPVVTVDGTLNATDVALSLACTNGAATGTIAAHWTGTRYTGTFSFNGGASTGSVDITGWSAQAPMPASRFALTAAAVNGIVFAIGGGDPSQASPVYAYDPLNNSWSTPSQLPTSREGAGAAAVNGKIYIVGGHVAGGIASGVLEAYDPVNNVWIPDLVPMPTPRAHLAVVTDGVFVYALGGDTIGSNGGAVPTVERYNPATNSWTTLAPMPTAGTFVTAGVLNGTIVVVGNGGNGPSNATDAYDIAANAWHAGAPMPAGRALAAAGVANGGLYVIGGTVNGQLAYDTWVYYPATNNQPDYWSGVGSMITARAQLAAAVVGDVIYALGGMVPGSNPTTSLASNEVLSTPPANTFAPGGAGGGGSNSLPTVQWQSTNPSVAGIDGSGSAHANSIGQTAIVATTSTGLSCATSNSCATLNVVDTQPPFLGLPNNMTREANSPLGAVVTFFASANDSVDGQRPVTCNPPSGSTFGFGTTTVTCSASDNSGNTATGSFTITVQDTRAPFLNVPSQPFNATATSAAGAVVTFGGAVSAFDSVDGSVTPSCTPAAGSTFAIGSTLVSCTAADAHGNQSAAKTFTVFVKDPPAVVVPANITAEATSASGAAVSFTVTASSFGSASLPVQCFLVTGFGNDGPQLGAAVASGATFPLGTTTVGCLATSATNTTNGNLFTITVRDTTAPVVTTSGNMIVPATAPGGSTATFSASATDSVDGSVVVACSPVSGSLFAIGVTTVTCSATDAHQNTGSATLTVTVLSPEQVTSNLIAQITALGFQQAHNLLQNLLESIDNGNTAAACNQLSTFINQVQAQSGKSLTASEATVLIDAATAARGALGCQG